MIISYLLRVRELLISEASAHLLSSLIGLLVIKGGVLLLLKLLVVHLLHVVLLAHLLVVVSLLIHYWVLNVRRLVLLKVIELLVLLLHGHVVKDLLGIILLHLQMVGDCYRLLLKELSFLCCSCLTTIELLSWLKILLLVFYSSVCDVLLFG